jgi:DNA-3-methyladenine glycosylase II
MTKNLDFFKKDPVLYRVITKTNLPELEERELFLGIVRSIVGQQLSVKAAATIFKRVESYFMGKITPEKIMKASEEDLRGCGMSYSKIRYLKDLSTRVIKKELDLEKIRDLSDEEFIEELTKVKGVGRWTAEMLLIFVLKREDIFSMGDLGLRNAVAKLYGVDRDDFEAIKKIVEKWAPFRSLASRYLWKSLDNLPK